MTTKNQAIKGSPYQPSAFQINSNEMKKPINFNMKPIRPPVVGGDIAFKPRVDSGRRQHSLINAGSNLVPLT